MLAGPDVVAALSAVGVTHVVWIPDSDLGTWDAALTAPDGLPLIRVMFMAQVVNGLLLPVILVFVMLAAERRGEMGTARAIGIVASGQSEPVQVRAQVGGHHRHALVEQQPHDPGADAACRAGDQEPLG